MRLTKIDKIFSCLLIVEFSTCFIVLENLNIFQFMLFVQIIPSILLALLSGSISSRIKHSWVLLIMFGMIYALMMFGIFRVTPMTLIEQNTIQSETSVFTFNRNFPCLILPKIFEIVQIKAPSKNSCRKNPK